MRRVKQQLPVRTIKAFKTTLTSRTRSGLRSPRFWRNGFKQQHVCRHVGVHARDDVGRSHCFASRLETWI